MSISAASVTVGATFAPTGGSATSLLQKSDDGNSVQTILDDGSILLSQKQVDFSTQAPKVSTGAPNGYTQARNTVVIKVPLTLDNGNRTVNTIRIELASDIETTDAERDTLRELAMHVLNDTDFDDFWNQQALS